MKFETSFPVSFNYMSKLELQARQDHVGFMADKVAVEQVFSECFCFPCQFSFQTHHHLTFAAATVGQ